ncbi:Mre11_DNA_bind domain-containing protein [Psidium guajava]|nr:Mre11_DNA_bind domain-containing protein [Psidium guajava]
MRPEPQEGCQVSDWFNILVLHQNRVKTNPKNAINEHFLPRFLDFIVWGHEHECIVDPQEVPGMGFHITQPGSSIATSLIDGESKPKHVLLLEIKGNQYRPTKIPLTSIRPFEYAEVPQCDFFYLQKLHVNYIMGMVQVVLKDVTDIDPNDQNSILEHLDKVVRNLVEKSKKQGANTSELKLPLIRIKVDYSGFMTINPQRFGQKYVGKVANPQDILIFSKASRKGRSESAKFDDSERLRPEELNQQNIEALVAENNLKMEILPVNDLDKALHEFVNKDDKMAFYSCVQLNLEETREKIARDSDTLNCEEEHLILKVGECLEDRVKERSVHPSDTPRRTSTATSVEAARNRSAAGIGSTVSFSDDEDTAEISKSATRGRRGSLGVSRSSRATSDLGRGKTSTRARGRGRGSSLKQTTLDSALGSRHRERSSASSEETGRHVSKDPMESSGSDENIQGKGRKRAAPRGRGRGTGASSKRGRKTDNSSINRMLLSNNDDDDEDDDDDVGKRPNKLQTRVTRNYGALRR